MPDRSAIRPEPVFIAADGSILRSVNPVYRENYERFCSSGLRERLCRDGLLVPFREADELVEPGSFKTLKAEKIEFVSYPYEWSFGQLKDAALLTLEIQKTALEHNMMLKDASAYNVQFRRGRPVFIDLLSFETADDRPWSAYGQFCSHFLAPLALMAKRDAGFNAVMAEYLDGIPLELASKLLPWKSRFSPGLLFHIHLHAKMQRRHQDGRAAAEKTKRVRVSVGSKIAFAESLRSLVRSLKLPESKTEWGDYYSDTNYGDAAFAAKKELVAQTAEELRPRRVLDLGANTGVFSPSRVAGRESCGRRRHRPGRGGSSLPVFEAREDCGRAAAADRPCESVSGDRLGQPRTRQLFLPLRFRSGHGAGARSPSGDHPQRSAVDDRRDAGRLGRTLLIEFVPKEDSQVRRLLSTREDIFPNYHADGFLAAFEPYFELRRRTLIPGTKRELFVFRKRGTDGAL